MSAAYQTAADTVTAKDGTVIVPGVALPTFRAIYVGVAGDIVVRFPSGKSVLHKNVAAGPFSAQGDMVVAAGTTATDLVAWY